MNSFDSDIEEVEFEIGEDEETVATMWVAT
jgi:hypothetical protein